VQHSSMSILWEINFIVDNILDLCTSYTIFPYLKIILKKDPRPWNFTEIFIVFSYYKYLFFNKFQKTVLSPVTTLGNYFRNI
jgi:hypothetical protein